MRDIITKKEYCLTNLNISPEVRIPSQSMRSILKKTPSYDIGFFKIRDFIAQAVVRFDKITNEPEVTVYFPAEIQTKMQSGEIPFDQEEFSNICRNLAEIARKRRIQKLHRTRSFKS